MSVVRQAPAAPKAPVLLRGAISRARVESILARAAAVFALLFAVQTLPAVGVSSQYLSLPFAISIAVVLFGLLLVILVTAAVNGAKTKPTHIAMGIFTVVYTIVLALWPVGLLRGGSELADQPWLWYLITIAMIFADIVFAPRWAALFMVDVTAVYVFIRTQPAGGSAPVALALLDGFYVVLIGAFALATITAIRAAADRVDAAQGTAMEQYTRAARNHAAELERAKVDALVHDTVLSTLIEAARAETPDQRRAAVQMSQAALKTLQSAPVAFDVSVDVPVAQLADRLADAARLLSPRIDFQVMRVDDARVPGAVAEAVFTAAQQALINSLQHAGDDADDVIRTVVLDSDVSSGLTVQISDTGRGFDGSLVPAARLGLRVSIRERMHAVGGRVRVVSVPGGGTSIVIEWEPST
ncbi:hypothetical protein B7R21_04165 [Subtercola boreus]|uniref:Histidine kinase/HSP90-like ATPase domain-containing protein n=1 Tax=Subtercola boreus TaxID=120213 RepID=A0A3E0VZQ8_9MICO|nr:ATP-binding protein [Subtercola boreus]RFA15231.1 hypothetical protein B7R21_04165 [Subtercola boreus]